ncbi:hypothetical protein PFLL34_03680 [Pseudomonas fluorescens]|nr:hypothetical protein PFLL34_03680 [Pseudomonas fluorescens]
MNWCRRWSRLRAARRGNPAAPGVPPPCAPPPGYPGPPGRCAAARPCGPPAPGAFPVAAPAVGRGDGPGCSRSSLRCCTSAAPPGVGAPARHHGRCCTPPGCSHADGRRFRRRASRRWNRGCGYRPPACRSGACGHVSNHGPSGWGCSQAVRWLARCAARSRRRAGRGHRR